MTANTNLDHPDQLAEKIAHREEILEELEQRLKQIGEPAAHELRKRLEALKVEEQALQRNYAEVQEGRSHPQERMQKVEALLHHIEREESSMQHEADFLSLGAPSSVSVAFRSGARLYDLGTRGLKRIFRDQSPWHSPFVNRTHESIMANFGPASKK